MRFRIFIPRFINDGCIRCGRFRFQFLVLIERPLDVILSRFGKQRGRGCFDVLGKEKIEHQINQGKDGRQQQGDGRQKPDLQTFFRCLHPHPSDDSFTVKPNPQTVSISTVEPASFLRSRLTVSSQARVSMSLPYPQIESKSSSLETARFLFSIR